MKKGISRLAAIVSVFTVLVGVCLLPSLITGCGGEVVPPAVTIEPLKVDLKVLANDLVATEDVVPWNVAYTLACISNAAYDDWPKDKAARAKKDLSKWGFKEIQPVPGKKKQFAYVLSDDDIVVVAFRGTDDWNDFRKDTWCVPASWQGRQVHAGFLSALSDVEEGVVSAVRVQGGEKKRLWITGHSLGGAMAFIFACKCVAEQKLSPTGVVTFGQPRCFDKKGCEMAKKELHEKYVRFMNEDDIVPSLPPPIVLPFVHSGARYGFFDGKTKFIDCTTLCAAPAPGIDSAVAAAADREKRATAEQYSDLERSIADVKKSESASTTAKPKGVGTSIRQLAKSIPQIRDHLMDNYLASIKKYYPPPGAEKTSP
jgi:hypothetical protein